jgi:hypothetical protein
LSGEYAQVNAITAKELRFDRALDARRALPGPNLAVTGHPGLGPRRLSSELAREKCGGIVLSPNGVWKVLCRHGLNTCAKRLGLIAGYPAPYKPPRVRLRPSALDFLPLWYRTGRV